MYTMDERHEVEIVDEEYGGGGDHVQFDSETGSCLEWRAVEGAAPVHDTEAAGPSNRPDCNSGTNSSETPEAHAEDIDDTADWEHSEWYQSLEGQASVLSMEHEKMAELLALQHRYEQEESKLRAELFILQKDRQATQRWRDQLMHDKTSEIEAATLEMKDLVSKLDSANPSWKNKLCFAEML